MVEIRILCNVIDTRTLIGPCSSVTSRCCQSVTPGMSPRPHYSAYSNWSLATYPFFSSSKVFYYTFSPFPISLDECLQCRYAIHPAEYFINAKAYTETSTTERKMKGGVSLCSGRLMGGNIYISLNWQYSILSISHLYTIYFKCRKNLF